MDQPTPLTKEQFMQQYVLARAATLDAMDGAGVAAHAEAAWNAIQQSCGSTQKEAGNGAK